MTMKKEYSSNVIKLKCGFLGGARYSHPLDATSEKKMRALKPLGELFIIGFSQNILPRQFTEHAHFYLMPQLPWTLLRYAEMLILGTTLSLWVIFRHRVQILVAQSPYEGVAAALAKMIAHWFGRKVVLVVESHGDFEKDLFSQRKIVFPSVYRFLMKWAVSLTLGQADLLRAVSNSTYCQLSDFKPESKIFKFMAWTDIEEFLQVGAKRNNYSSQQILYAGVLIPRKGVDRLIDAFAEVVRDFTSAELLIVGREDDKIYASNLKEQVSRLALQDLIQFWPEVSQQGLAEQMGETLVFVLPSLSEGLGRVVIEAMATGTPAIASNVGGIPDMIQEGINGFLIPPGDEEALADRLRWMLEHPTEAQEMGYHARAFAEQFFSTATYVQGYGKIFEAAQELLNQGGMNHAPSTF